MDDQSGCSPAPSQVTELLNSLRAGESDALEQLLPLLYDNLRELARHHLRDEQDGHTLGPTALVHEAYVRLARSERLEPVNRQQFFAMAGRAMRRVLVDHARHRKALKRGGGAKQVSFDDVASWLTQEQAEELVVLDSALDRLATVDPRSAAVVEMRFFGGFTLAETAEHFSVSIKTIQRDWVAARAWLRKEVQSDMGWRDTVEILDRAMR